MAAAIPIKRIRREVNRAYAVTTNGESIARSIHTAAIPDRAALIGAQEVLGGTP